VSSEAMTKKQGDVLQPSSAYRLSIPPQLEPPPHLVPAAAAAAWSADRPSQATCTLFTLVSWLRVPSTSSSAAPSCRRAFIWLSTCGGKHQSCRHWLGVQL